MRHLSSLILELESLPKGNVYKKTISGKEYFYHQYSENGKMITKLVNKSDLDELLKNIVRRQSIEKILRDSNPNKQQTISLSENARHLTGSVMHKDEEVARFINGELVYIDENRSPFLIKRTHSLSNWLMSRVIDNTRVNSRLLKKAFNINESKEEMVPLYAHAASISDRYWFKPKQSKLKYKDIIFENDIYSEISLEGSMLIYPNKPKASPELTTIGSFEKGWKYINNEWWLYKVGNTNEIFSELLAYEISMMLLIPSATYEYDEPYIRSLNFAEHQDYESLQSYLGDDSSYSFVFSKLKELGDYYAKAYLRLIFCDVLVNNVDRHNENIGFLRDERTGKIVSLAPNFDNNLALISRTTDLVLDPSNDGFMKHFIKEISKNEEMMKMFKELDIPIINENIIEMCISRVPVKVDNIDRIKQYLLNRYNYLIFKLK